MKQTQWVAAVIILAVMVFIGTFAMNYLGGTANKPDPLPSGPAPVEKEQALVFPAVQFPPPPPPSIPVVPRLPVEEHSTGHHDFWFTNSTSRTVPFGLEKKNCACTSVEAFVLSEQQTAQVLARIAALPLLAFAAPIPGLGAASVIAHKLDHPLAVEHFQKGVKGTELKDRAGTSTVEMPPRASGWIRMKWAAERQGPQDLAPRLWVDSVETGSFVDLRVQLHVFEPYSVIPSLHLGTIRDDALERGLQGDIICFSHTRPSLKVEAKFAVTKTGPGALPLEIGTPEALSRERMLQILREHNERPEKAYSVWSAYRIPVAVKVTEKDRKAVGLGLLRRRVLVSVPDAKGDEKEVMVEARVRGVLEVGTDEKAEVAFYTFRAKNGKRVKVNLSSDVSGLKLELDRERTAPFLNVTLTPQKSDDSRWQVWEMTAEVKKGETSGKFPRRGDPTYEDCAIYLKASVGGAPPRPVRIPVSGDAQAG